MALTLPYPTFTNGQTADAAKVMANFYAIADFVNETKLDASTLPNKVVRADMFGCTNFRRSPALSGVVSIPSLVEWRSPNAVSLVLFRCTAEFAAGGVTMDLLKNGALVVSVPVVASGVWVGSGALAPASLVAGDVLSVRLTSLAVTNLCRASAVVRATSLLEAS
jgi:hypothetical protein